MLSANRCPHRLGRSSFTVSWRFRRRSRLGISFQSQCMQSDFANRPFTGFYEAGQPTSGPLGDIPLIGRVGPTPKMLKHHLDQFVVGQDRAKKVISTAVFNHYQRILELRRRDDENQRLFQQTLRRERGRPHPVQDEYPGHTEATSNRSHPEDASPRQDTSQLTLEKSNILLLGPSGVGKTLMAKTLARVLEVPFSMSDCTTFTQAGYVGEDVQVCIERLLAAADFDVEAAEHGIIVLDEVDKIAAQKTAQGRDVGGEGVQQALLKIIEGTTLQIQVKSGTASSNGSGRVANQDQNVSANQNFGSKYALNPPSGPNIGGSSAANKHEVFSVKTDNILFVLTGAFVGLHKHVLSRIQKGSIGFASSIKPSALTKSDNEMIPMKPDSEEGRLLRKHMPSGFQNIVEATTRFNVLDLVDPSDLQSYGMIPELIGRVPVTAALSPLDEDELVRVLVEPRNSLIKQYEQLFSLSGIEMKFTSEALREVAMNALQMTTGARALRTCVEGLLSEAMFETPGSSVKYVLITGEVARGRDPPIYLARGQQHKFQSMFSHEEETFARRTQSRSETDQLGQAGETQAKSFEEYRARSTAAGYS